MKKIFIAILTILIIANSAYATTIHGTVYDFSLEKIKNVIVEVNTEPIQRQIAKNGSYYFNVPNGKYIISAKKVDNTVLATENITVAEEGNYTLDLIAFVDLGEEQELLNDTALDISTDITPQERQNYPWLVILIVVIFAIAGLAYYLTKRKKQPKEIEEIKDDLTNKVIEIIKKDGGRTTQKELRKKLPYSEAKISLVITELESKGKIEKIKKGRSNVIILKNN